MGINLLKIPSDAIVKEAQSKATDDILKAVTKKFGELATAQDERVKKEFDKMAEYVNGVEKRHDDLIKIIKEANANHEKRIEMLEKERKDKADKL